MNDFEFNKVLKRLKKEMFSAAFDPNVCDMNMSQLARKTGCARGTLYRLYYNRTKSPHYRTVLKLCRAVGADMELVHEELAVSKYKRKAS